MLKIRSTTAYEIFKNRTLRPPLVATLTFDDTFRTCTVHFSLRAFKYREQYREQTPVRVQYIPKKIRKILFWNGLYRASHVLEDLGWVDLDLGSSPGWWNIPNPSQQNPVFEDMGRPVQGPFSFNFKGAL